MWGLIGLSLLVITIITISVVWGVIARRSAISPGALEGAPLTSGGAGMMWIYVGMPLTVVALVGSLFWTMAALASVDRPAAVPRLTIDVTGRQWWWEVHYPGPGPEQGFETANEIHIPVGEPVLIRLHGGDVIHSFWVPALSGKTDTIPGRENLAWLQANRAGVYRGQCTEYCGLQHAHMAAFVIAQPRDEFDAWRNNQLKTGVPAATPVTAMGEATFVDRCGKCHAVEGTAANGRGAPNLTHLMTRQTLAAGVLDNNIDNLSGWISDPQAQKPGANMPITFLSGPQLRAVVAYLETLR
jgi:cytochrome c oxidase subunit 2